MQGAAGVRVVAIEVDALFGLYDHVIALNLEDRVTIVHGPNGVGKTAMLRLVAAAFSGRLFEFTRVPLREFRVRFNDGSTLCIAPLGLAAPIGERRRRAANGSQRVVLRRSAAGQAHEDAVDAPEWTEESVRRLAEERGLVWDGRGRWRDESEGIALTSGEVALSFPLRSGFSRVRQSEPEWFVGLRTQVPVHFIEAQRLIRALSFQGFFPDEEEAPQWIPTVRADANELTGRLKDALARYANESQQLDRTFPQRLLRDVRPPLSQEEIQSRLARLEERRTRLQRLGLLDDSGAVPLDAGALENVDAASLRMMTLYLEDNEQKLGVLDDLSRRIELLLDNVNGKFQHKSIRVDSSSGLLAIGHDGKEIHLDVLSSGEQHQLVLLYDLLFRVAPNTLVLIDEPELSLHVGWQKRFLPDLLAITQTASIDALVATHSPQIVGDRVDLMVGLVTDLAADPS